jgi:hypothetical protein
MKNHDPHGALFPDLRDARLRGLRLARRWLQDTCTWLDTYLDHTTPASSDPRRDAEHSAAPPERVDEATSNSVLRSAQEGVTQRSPTRARFWNEASRQARQRMDDLVRQGCNVGPACYGYDLLRFAFTDHAGRIRHRSRLTPIAGQARIVWTIFVWRAVHCMTPQHITAELQRDPRRFPPPPARHPDRPAVWRVHTVERILTNPRYTGYQVRGYRAEDGSLTPREQWTISDKPAHWAIVTDELFWHAQNPTREAGRELGRRLRLLTEEGPHRCA